MTNEQKIQIIFGRLYKIWPNPKTELIWHSPVQLMVAVMLSAQATDKSVNMATPALFAKYPAVQDFASADIDELDLLISRINFHRTKAKNIIAACQMIVQKFNGVVPQTIKELDSLPGIARKSANVILGDAFGIHSGIAVDTHIIRLANCLGLTDSKDPVKIERDLMRIVPQDKWTDFSHLMVLYGRYYCPARKSCCECELLADLCE